MNREEISVLAPKLRATVTDQKTPAAARSGFGRDPVVGARAFGYTAARKVAVR